MIPLWKIDGGIHKGGVAPPGDLERKIQGAVDLCSKPESEALDWESYAEGGVEVWCHSCLSQLWEDFRQCLWQGWRGGWIAHLMDCPATTGFDTKLRICNYIKALPRCSRSKCDTFYMKSCRVEKYFIPFNAVFYNSNLFLNF